MKKQTEPAKYPGTRVAMDGNTAAIMCERESSDAAGAYPITPSTQMGEYWADAAAKGTSISPIGPSFLSSRKANTLLRRSPPACL